MDNSNLNKEIQDNENVVDNNVNSNNDVNVNPMINNSLNDNVNNTSNANTEVASSIESNEVKASSSEITPLKEVEEVKVNQENQNVNKDIEPENNEKVNQTSDKKINGFEISLIIIIILLIVVIGIILYKMYFADKKEDNKNNTNDNENGEVAKPNEGEYTLNIYKTESGSLCSKKSDYCSNVAYTIKTETKDAEVLDFSNNDLLILYKDNDIKIYDTKNDSIKTTKLRLDLYYYSLLDDEGKYLKASEDKNVHKFSLYNIETGEKLFSDAIYSDTIYLERYNDKYYIFAFNEQLYGYDVYTENETFITTVTFDSNGDHYSIYNGNLYSFRDGKITKYNIDGQLLETKDFPKNQFKNIVKDYVLYLDDNNYLSLMNIETEKSIQIVKWNDNYELYGAEYYDEDYIKNMNKNTETGVYITLYYRSGKDASGNYGMKYCYTDDGEIKTYPIEYEMGGREKPVLYLYPNEKTNIKVEFEHPEYLTTTYPKYTNSWNVTAYPNGDLYDENNKYYYALYWDETRYHEVDFKEGFYVTKENAISFLEEKLDIIGLNKKEKNEFIMYWLPILERNEQNLVYFELTEEREATNKLIITPKPDALLRVSIHIKKVDKEIEIKEQHLEKFKRDGFVAVEWGGMTY